VALIVDTGALYAQADSLEPSHRAVVKALQSESEELITSQFVVAEADYFILKRLGIDVELAFLRDLEEATFLADSLTTVEIGIARNLVAQYRDLELGIADASLVVLAQRWNTLRILTLDERAFRNIAPLQGGSFVVLPADSDQR
jgi:predicted nucleic acid-binding protein